MYDKKRNRETDRMMRNILTHAHPQWREQRSTCARILDLENQDRMKKEKSWSSAHELGQFVDEMEWLSDMVESVQWLVKLGKDG